MGDNWAHELGPIVSRAVQLDKEHKYDLALKAYEEVLAKILEYLQDPRATSKADKKLAKKYFQMYLERAELIKALLPTLKTNPGVRERISSSGKESLQKMPETSTSGKIVSSKALVQNDDRRSGAGQDSEELYDDGQGSIALEDYELLKRQLEEAESLQRATLERKQSAEDKVKALEKEMKNIESSIATKEMRRLKALEKVVREDFLCPITMEIMVDPVVAFDGYTYERAAIMEWYTKNNMSPMTGLPVDSKSLLANHTLKSAIISWKDKMESENLIDS